MNYVFLVILIFFASIGVSTLTLHILYHFSKVKDENSTILVIPDINKNLDVEFTLRSLISKIRLLGCPIQSIICIDENLDTDTKKRISLMAKDFSYLKLMTKEEYKKEAGL